MRWLTDPRATGLVVGASVVLLGILATLQYRWLGEVSRAEHERMRANLETAAASFATDFDRELMRALLHFQPGASGDLENLSADVAAQLKRWQETAPHAELVDEILWLDRGPDGSWVLRHLDSISARFEIVDWNPELDPLRRRLDREVSPRDGLPSHQVFFAAEIPAVLIPYFELPIAPFGRTPVGRPPEGRIPMPSGLLVIRLDGEFLRETLLPLLGVRYLGGRGSDEELDYRFAVLAKAGVRPPGVRPPGAEEGRQWIYRSEPSPGEAFAEEDRFEGVRPTGDCEVELFGPLAPAELRKLWIEVQLGAPASRSPFGMGRGRRGRRGMDRGGWRSPVFGGFRDGPDGRPPDGRPPDGRPPDGLDDRSGAWTLIVRHPDGSLESAVARARHRNLAVSSAVLVLLGSTVAMLLVSIRRARELAGRQVEFVAGMTHELRTPLAAIRSLAQNLADGIVEGSEQARRYGAALEREGSRLSAMVEQVLELSGILSERKAYAFEAVSIAAVAKGAVADSRALLARDGRLEEDIPEGLPEVRADSEALKRAIQNLIANAIKYGGEEQWVGIELSTRSSVGRDEVVVRVSDHGAGIADEDLPRLFDAFYRGRAAMSAQIPGSGLGLNLVRHVVEAHDGRIEVATEPGKGSTFTMCLPALEKNEDDASEDLAG